MNKEQIFVTGANGMVGSYLKEVFDPKELTLTDLPEMDVTDAARISEAIAKARPEAVIHLAAATDVDRCETDHKYAESINVEATKNVARACKKVGCVMIYVSTGFVFNGKGRTLHSESDKTDPVNFYGKTKLEGEWIVADLVKDHYIVRAEWMIGGGPGRDKKFVGKIIEMMGQGKDINAVDDMYSTPTFAKDFVKGLKVITDKKLPFGLYHMANKGVCSRYEMALEVARLMGSSVKVNPVPGSRFPLPAPRAQSSGIENKRLLSMGLDIMPEWKDSLRQYVGEWLDKQ